MKELIKSLSKLSIPAVLNILSSLLRNKILAIVVGPLGLGIYSQITNLTNLVFATLPIGSLGLLRYTSNYYENNKTEEIAFLFKYFFKRNIIIAIFLAATVVIFRDYISTYLFSNKGYSNYLLLLSGVIPINIISSFIDIYLRGIRKMNIYVLFLSLGSVLSLIVTIPLILIYGIFGIVLSIVLTVIANVSVGFLIIKKYNLFLNFKSKSKLDKTVISSIYKFGIASIISLVLQNVVILIIKSVVALKLALQEVGLFQSIYSISTGYFGIFFTLVSTYSIPKLSAYNSRDDINNEINTTIKFLILTYTPIIISLYVFRSVLMPLLYSSDFDQAKILLVYQLPGEFFKAFSWVMGLWLVPTVRIKQWITFEIVYYFFYLSFFFLLIDYFKIGLKSTSISYLMSYIIFFILNYIYFYRNNNFKFTKDNIKIVLYSCIFITLSFSVSYFYEIEFYYYFIPLFIIWVLLSYKKEDVEQIIKLFKAKIAG